MHSKLKYLSIIDVTFLLLKENKFDFLVLKGIFSYLLMHILNLDLLQFVFWAKNDFY